MSGAARYDMSGGSPPSAEAVDTVPASSAAPDVRPAGKRGPQPLLVEIAWEVCNQLGGIYTVLRSKVPSMIGRWGSHYCLVGPYIRPQAAVEFEESPLTGRLGEAAARLRELGIYAHYGRWLVTGRPHVILLEYWHLLPRLHEIKYRLWNDHGISMPADDQLLNDCVAFGEACRQLLWALSQQPGGQRPIVAHFHEWMSGVAIPMLRRDGWPGTTVFTTHATLLGRYLATNDEAFYDHLPLVDPDAEARHYNIEPAYRLERAAAHGSHVFTTVSDRTAEECIHLLGRNPDVLLPNGLNIQRFAAVHEFQNLHRQFKERLHHFTLGHFFPSYTFDLDKTIYFFTSGRYEYRNKGMDVTIEALARLNWRLKVNNVDRTVVFFIITRAPFRSISVGSLQSQAMLEEFQTVIQAYKDQIGRRLLVEAAEGHVPDLNALVDDYWRLRLRRDMHAWRHDWLPPIVTHDLIDDAKDAVLNRLRACQLWNKPDDKVKVVFHPDFVTTTSPLFGMEYEQFVRGCHLGVFPSYYEPWGYTPLEAVALGTPAITSDLSGFGSYLEQLLPEHAEKGVWVIGRRRSDFNRAADQLADVMFRFAQLTRRERVNLRNQVESFSQHFDWSNLAQRYHEAHGLALDRMRPG